MSARDRIQDMIRTDRGDMNVYSQPEVRDALDAYRAEVIAELEERPATEADDTPDFFQPGHTYIKGQDGYKAPEQTWTFSCVAVSDHPREGAGRRAFGFMRQGIGSWDSSAIREGEYDRGWADVTEGGGRRG
ncbi:hypothetical protein ACH4UY_04680 [Streptomyces longwoodensis]|uniref:hypothetical protein n=1 Tax=Streptomyces longwoodensis TaxID=68231 RepID=UPI0037AAABD6